MSWRPTEKLRAILFDLDGTLADTAPDLGYALNSQRLARGLPELGIVELRKQASSGARGLLETGFGIRPADAGYIEMRDEFLDIYEQNLSRSSTLFPGIPDLLALIEKKGLIWGVVTNKAERFTLPLLKALKLLDRSACVICGDTTPHAKPHPAPMLEAMSRTGTIASECLYIGDDERDVQAAHAAGIQAVVVRYGYLGNGTPPENWGAEVIVDSPGELSAILFGR
jgi:2-phosphoglycolate phosphatase